ncbi:MAG: ABATE domain-containing protein [Bryobacteraceae bacterium]
MVTEYHGPGNLSKIIKRLPVKFIGGRLCLDFVNTVGGRDRAGAVLRDKIGSYEDLLAWSVLAGIIDRRRAGGLARLAARDSAEAAKVLERAIRLREALYRIFKCVVEAWRPPEADADVLHSELAIARSHQRLAAHGDRFGWIFLERPDALDRILWPVPLSAAELLTSGDLPRLGQCRGGDCGWMFLDTSRNHRRQWCDMQDCGNRAKVKKFREKQRAI